MGAGCVDARRSCNGPVYVLMDVFSTPMDTFNAPVDAFSTPMDTLHASMDLFSAPTGAFWCAHGCFLVRSWPMAASSGRMAAF